LDVEAEVKQVKRKFEKAAAKEFPTPTEDVRFADER
jgi:hypothetical protein